MIIELASIPLHGSPSTPLPPVTWALLHPLSIPMASHESHPICTERRGFASGPWVFTVHSLKNEMKLWTEGPKWKQFRVYMLHIQIILDRTIQRKYRNGKILTLLRIFSRCLNLGSFKESWRAHMSVMPDSRTGNVGSCIDCHPNKVLAQISRPPPISRICF